MHEQPDPRGVQEFTATLMGFYRGAMLTLMIDLGHRTGLLEAAARGPATSPELAERAAEATAAGMRPGLAAVLVGDDPASISYVSMKAKACPELGIVSETFHLPAETTETQLLALVARLNADERYHAILPQLPLPPQINERDVIDAIDPAKDVDGLHPVNLGRLLPLIEDAVQQPLVLVVDDDADLCQSLWDVLRERRFRVSLAGSGEEAVNRLQDRCFRVVLVDLRLPDSNGAAVARRIHERCPEARIVLMTGHREEMQDVIAEALAAHADAVCYKPLDLPQFEAMPG